MRKFFPGAVGIIPMVYFLFFYRFSFNFEVEENGHYLLLLFFSLAQVCRIVFPASRGGLVQGRILDGLGSLTILALYLLLGPGNEYASVFLSLVIGFIFFFQADVQTLIYLLYGFIPFLLIEIVLAAIQYCQGLPVRGSLQNTGIFSIYLSLHIPLVFYAIYKNKLPRILLLLFLLFSLGVILEEHSRTALISILLIMASLMYERVNGISRKVWYVAAPGGVILLSGLAWYLYSLKKLSAQGRLLMSNIAFKHITDQFWWGTGIGRFTWYYPQWQSAYFRDTSASPPHFYLSAGESYVIFNEYLQAFETVGVFGFIGCLLVLIAFFKTQSREYKDLLRAIKLTMVAILACGFTSYPFHVNIIFFLFVVCLSIGFKISGKVMSPRFFRFSWAGSIAFIFSGILFALALNQCAAVWRWQQIRSNTELPYGEKKIGYSKLYPTLKNDGKFLTDYGAFLADSVADIAQSVRLLEEARQHFFSKQTIEALGYAYWKANDLPNAVACFEWENNYLPNLFGPKLMLMKLYKETGDTGRMRAIGRVIISTPPKIPSEEVNAIKYQAKEFLLRNY